MKLIWMTDLHLGMASAGTLRKFLHALGREKADVALVGGDMGDARSLGGHLHRVAEAAGCPTYFVLGNHDHYGATISSVREEAASLHEQHPLLSWLPLSGVVSLSPGVALVGEGCWGDCRVGSPEDFVTLNDEFFIQDLKGKRGAGLADFLGGLGLESSARLREHLSRSLDGHESVIVLTHVAPTRSSALHEGRPPDDYFAPRFVCQSAGAAILEVMADHPSQGALVLCGHSHGGGTVALGPNVVAIAGRAVYGMPRVNGQFRL